MLDVLTSYKQAVCMCVEGAGLRRDRGVSSKLLTYLVCSGYIFMYAIY